MWLESSEEEDIQTQTCTQGRGGRLQQKPILLMP